MPFPILGAALFAGGLLGSATQKRPKYNMSAMNASLALINKQAQDIESYFGEAGKSLEEQFGGYKADTMDTAVNALANQGIYESPASELSLGRTRKALAESYAGAKSELAGQKLSAIGDIDRQRIGYYQNLANLQYQAMRDKASSKSGLFGTIGGLGASILGANIGAK